MKLLRDNKKIVHRINENGEALCIICGIEVPDYETYEKCCDGFMCGCMGRRLPNDEFPTCQKHKGDTRQLVFLINRRDLYTLEKAKQFFPNNYDYQRVLTLNRDRIIMLERFSG